MKYETIPSTYYEAFSIMKLLQALTKFCMTKQLFKERIEFVIHELEYEQQPTNLCSCFYHRFLVAKSNYEVCLHSLDCCFGLIKATFLTSHCTIYSFLLYEVSVETSLLVLNHVIAYFYAGVPSAMVSIKVIPLLSALLDLRNDQVLIVFVSTLLCNSARENVSFFSFFALIQRLSGFNQYKKCKMACCNLQVTTAGNFCI